MWKKVAVAGAVAATLLIGFLQLAGAKYTQVGQAATQQQQCEAVIQYADLPADATTQAMIDRNASTWILKGRNMGVPTKGIMIGLAVIGVESGGLNLASRKVPESMTYPNDRVAAGDHDSIGTAQQRVIGWTWWPSIAEGMKVDVQAGAFYRALLAVPGWESMSISDAASAVQHPAAQYESRYGEKYPWAVQLYNRLAGTVATDSITPIDCTPGGAAVDPAVVVSGEWANPLKPAHYLLTSPFGWRLLRGMPNFHKGQDFAVPTGTPVFAPCTGTVVRTTPPAQSYGAGNETELDCGGGYTIRLQHQSAFATTPGATVQAGQKVGYSGNTGNSTGPHLHLQLEEKGNPIDPLPFFKARGVPL